MKYSYIEQIFIRSDCINILPSFASPGVGQADKESQERDCHSNGNAARKFLRLDTGVKSVTINIKDVISLENKFPTDLWQSF